MNRRPRPVSDPADLALADNLPDSTLAILAWDISDAIAKTADVHGIDVGMDAIEHALLDFLSDVLAYAREAETAQDAK